MIPQLKICPLTSGVTLSDMKEKALVLDKKTTEAGHIKVVQQYHTYNILMTHYGMMERQKSVAWSAIRQRSIFITL